MPWYNVLDLAVGQDVFYENLVGSGGGFYDNPLVVNVVPPVGPTPPGIAAVFDIDIGGDHSFSITGLLPEGSIITKIRAKGTVTADGAVTGTAYLDTGHSVISPDSTALVGSGTTAEMVIPETDINPAQNETSAIILVVNSCNATRNFTFEFTQFDVFAEEVEVPCFWGELEGAIQQNCNP